ncbi:hypothetical protein C2S53_009038 [Perilla frutescens var. hirtella]|uniref:Uncharacterized protein n=1 Tax=Perilla frutescens var. hirtella TaxID=608512 RepID=A0AAD4JR70_PERFH|nr:hypothetical protein C2S53_009038 [Perilla frutescens var. hirtella]
MDHKKSVDDNQRWLVSNSTENAAQLRQNDDGNDDDDDEALSLSDLPLIHQWRKEKKEDDDDHISSKTNTTSTPPEEFDFCSLSKESEMCAADEVFFQGQILPLRRHSVSSEKGSLLHHYDGRYRSRSISRSDSMDHYYSSRSSSISSGQSSSSGSSSATAARYNKPKLPPRNQFHSHPSPSPRLHFPSNRHGVGSSGANNRNSIKKSSIWNVLRLGLVTGPPEIAFQDLKARSSNSCRNFGSRNSTSSSISGGGEKKKIGRRLLGGGCRCAADDVETVAPARVVIIKRSASENSNDVVAPLQREEIKPQKLTKKHLSHHRTFEWLKQLPVADEP